MTKWATKRFGNSDYVKVQDQLQQMMITLGTPPDLMMFSRTTDDRREEDIYIGLPDTVPLEMFPGFAEIARDALPDFLTTLVAREDGFADRFPDIAKKRKLEP